MHAQNIARLIVDIVLLREVGALSWSSPNHRTSGPDPRIVADRHTPVDGIDLHGASNIESASMIGESSNMSERKKSLVVIGNGMVGHRLLTTLVAEGGMRSYR